MREDKWRGQRLDNDEWVFGDLVTCSKKHAYIITYFEKGEFLQDEDLTACKCVIHKVKTDTVGQFTELPDKNGKEIYKGDIVVGDSNIKFVIMWSKKQCCFFGKSKNTLVYCDARNFCGKEIIGNIYDNPDLIGEAIGA